VPRQPKKEERRDGEAPSKEYLEQADGDPSLARYLQEQDKKKKNDPKDD
jgi:hypothetical protein